MWDNMKINIDRIIKHGVQDPDYYKYYPENVVDTLTDLSTESSFYAAGMLFDSDEKGNNNFYLSYDSKWVEEYTVGNTFMWAGWSPKVNSHPKLPSLKPLDE